MMHADALRRLWLLCLAVCLLTGCGANSDPAADSTPAAQVYTAVLFDCTAEPPSTGSFSYTNDTTVGQILQALEAHLGISAEFVSAEMYADRAVIVCGAGSALCSAASEEILRGWLDSIYATVRQNYGSDKAVYLTLGDGSPRFGIDFSGASPYSPRTDPTPTPGEGELSEEDARLYAINLTYGMLGSTEIDLGAALLEVIAIGEEYYYDISVFSTADPGSTMRRFAISFDGFSAYLYNPHSDAFERF